MKLKLERIHVTKVSCETALVFVLVSALLVFNFFNYYYPITTYLI